jgi:hypothetical protein
MFKKFEASALDVAALYVCMGFVTYIIGAIAYNVGKDKGKEEERKKRQMYDGYYYDEREPF